VGFAPMTSTTFSSMFPRCRKILRARREVPRKVVRKPYPVGEMADPRAGVGGVIANHGADHLRTTIGFPSFVQRWIVIAPIGLLHGFCLNMSRRAGWR